MKSMMAKAMMRVANETIYPVSDMTWTTGAYF